MKQYFYYLDVCIKEINNIKSTEYVQNILKDYTTTISLASAIGYLYGKHAIATFLSPFVDTKWKNPESGYLLFVEGATLLYGSSYYTKLDASFLEHLKSSLLNVLLAVVNGTSEEQLKHDVDEIVSMEVMFAKYYTPSAAESRTFEPQYNVFTISELTEQYSFFDWQTFLDNVVYYGNEKVKQMVRNPDFRVVIVNTNYILNADRQYRPIIGKPRFYRTPKKPDFKRKAEASSEEEDHCLYSSIKNLEYANGRMFIDAKYPDEESRNALKIKLAKLFNNIINTFGGMISQLSWMDANSKLGAYNKIDNLVRNLAYPDFIMNNTELTDYYAALDIDDNDGLRECAEKLLKFRMSKSINSLAEGKVERDNFNGPPGLVNAWYQPELNSITFPAAILDQPFYDPDWPASLNYGGIGVVAGHELTHGFDDQGVQWNGKGVLYKWLSDSSHENFTTMASCVINEYGKFCPPTMNVCLDGVQTQGENIADNGGINVAYRAYKNYYSIFGQDPALPGKLSYLTHDQLFFMGFAQVWCDYNEYGSQSLVLVDPHSPAYYRVFGTIKNFPAFKNAYNCPEGSTYAPNKHCNVWVSDTDADSNQRPNNVNVQAAKTIPPTDERFKAYSDAVALLRYSMNYSADPCEDFYSYACGQYDKSVSFTIIRNKNYRHIAEEMEKSKYQTVVSALKKTIQFYEACKTARIDYESAKKNGEAIKQIVDEFSSATGLRFSMFDTPAQSQKQILNAETLGKAVGILSTYGVDTLITPMVDTNWKSPSTFHLFIDQNTLYYDKSYYTVDAWNVTEGRYRGILTELFSDYTAMMNKSLSNNTLDTYMNKFIQIELTLASEYSSTDTERRQYERSYNDLIKDNFTFIDLDSYMSFNDLKKLNDEFYNVFNTEDIINYMFYRLLAEYSDFIPKRPQAQHTEFEAPKVYLGRMKKRPVPLPREQNTDVSLEIKEQCAYETLNLMQYANARFFANYRYPNETDLQNMIDGLNSTITNILTSFESMMRQTLSGDDESIIGGYNKIKGVYRNIAYPDFIFDNQKLDEYYSDLTFVDSDDYFAMRRKLLLFNYQLSFISLGTAVDRHDFLGPPATANAWYQPELNSITFPDGILMQPFFDLNWPKSLNYGGIGVVAGHELSHGFDDEGVQWNGQGELYNWMQEASKKKFAKTAKCIIDEYHEFCPLDNSTYTPNCLNGENTQGENIADNGGIHAAWISYKNIVDLQGEDPRLPDDVLQHLTHDQLFFISFAQVWCQKAPSDEAIYRAIMTDPHSPAKYRVIGTVQNFPAFRNAFNCPALPKSEKHCSVWVPES
uniref:Neprilysin n=1 Tax=Syphacia muris TaxID=451379 RepID=A0A0N5ANT2_9BILA